MDFPYQERRLPSLEERRRIVQRAGYILAQARSLRDDLDKGGIPRQRVETGWGSGESWAGRPMDSALVFASESVPSDWVGQPGG